MYPSGGKDGLSFCWRDNNDAATCPKSTDEGEFSSVSPYLSERIRRHSVARVFLQNVPQELARRRFLPQPERRLGG
jgi:hypothetical protein